MSSWQQEIVQAEDREHAQRKFLNAPFSVLINSINSDTEQAKVSFMGVKDRLLTIPQPFRSKQAWIRAIPLEGDKYLAAYRADESNPHLISSLTRDSLKANDEYRSGVGVYRPLLPGEIEVSSVGFAQSYYSRRPKLDQRAGSITRWADQEKLMSGDRAPIHTRQVLQYRSNELGEEERFGIISRPKLLDSGEFSTWEVSYPKVNDQFTAEHYMSIKNPSNENPAVLFTLHKGHVLDDRGEPIVQSRTQIPLRVFEEYFAIDDSSTRFEMDEKGNYYIELADAASEGYELYVPTGSYKKNIGVDEEVFIDGNVSRTIGKSSTYQIGDNWTILVDKDYNLTSETGQMGFFMKSADPSQMILNTRNHFLVFDDTSGKEAIFLIHNTGSQINLDSKGSVKLIASDGTMAFLDATNNAVTVTSSKGSYVTLKDNVTISDKSGGQILDFDGKDTINISASTAVNLMAQKVTIGGGSINLGNIAPLSAALAEPLAILFDTHIHASPVGPTSPPLPPMTAALMNVNPATSFASQFIKIRSNLA